MSGEELRQAAIEIYGPRGWISRLAADLEVDRSTVHRWLQGVAIPGPVKAAVRCWLECRKAGIISRPFS